MKGEFSGSSTSLTLVTNSDPLCEEIYLSREVGLFFYPFDLSREKCYYAEGNNLELPSISVPHKEKGSMVGSLITLGLASVQVSGDF